MLEKFLFSKVPTWTLVTAAMLGLVGMFGFGVLVNDDLSGKKRLGVISQGAAAIAKAPETVLVAMKAGNRGAAGRTERFGDQAGWSRSEAGATLNGYVLLSRLDGDIGATTVELVDLSDFSTVHRWPIDAATLLDGANREGIVNPGAWSNALYRSIHPWVTDNADLIVKSQNSPIMRISPCGQPIWRQDTDMFHHSIEPDRDGNFWVPAHLSPSPSDAGKDVLDDGVALIGPDGSIVEIHSINKAIEDSNLLFLLFAMQQPGFNTDPAHLNDIQPVPGDGPFWRAGDVFLSLRNISTIALFRPSTGKIVWYKTGPWMAQHDVDIVDDTTISVFSNNTYDKGKGMKIDGTNELLFYDFASDRVTTPYGPGFRDQDFVGRTEGLADQLPDGSLMVEETNSGRLVFLSAQNELMAQYLNRAQDGTVYLLNWSRYIDQDYGDALRSTLSGTNCAGN